MHGLLLLALVAGELRVACPVARPGEFLRVLAARDNSLDPQTAVLRCKSETGENLDCSVQYLGEAGSSTVWNVAVYGVGRVHVELAWNDRRGTRYQSANVVLDPHTSAGECGFYPTWLASRWDRSWVAQPEESAEIVVQPFGRGTSADSALLCEDMNTVRRQLESSLKGARRGLILDIEETMRALNRSEDSDLRAQLEMSTDTFTNLRYRVLFAVATAACLGHGLLRDGALTLTSGSVNGLAKELGLIYRVLLKHVRNLHPILGLDVAEDNFIERIQLHGPLCLVQTCNSLGDFQWLWPDSSAFLDCVINAQDEDILTVHSEGMDLLSGMRAAPGPSNICFLRPRRRLQTTIRAVLVIFIVVFVCFGILASGRYSRRATVARHLALQIRLRRSYDPHRLSA
ncbi:hypothetical protein GMRT_22383 [Giardia muris]|uniref:Uncharacterized protein n=1 Tax=Giardia muris TaxID=5742 RepID=A0A4Z1T6F7_GIAMU|nr:hypothetical protein GMRT_13243 [Giardia muris]TNJ28722.1 hypothetical protein GMRT_22383 [Giardia muris]|eukprot:TNJ28717.1 hypothetical protein GMRT_13243 [Giardia muris]